MSQAHFNLEEHDGAGKKILALSEELARISVDRHYADDPQLMEKFGEAGYQSSLRDARHSIATLAEAVALGDSGLFSRYADWLEGILKRAGLAADILPRHFSYLSQALEKLLPNTTRALALEVLDQALNTSAGAEGDKP